MYATTNYGTTNPPRILGTCECGHAYSSGDEMCEGNCGRVVEQWQCFRCGHVNPVDARDCQNSFQTSAGLAACRGSKGISRELWRVQRRPQPHSLPQSPPKQSQSEAGLELHGAEKWGRIGVTLAVGIPVAAVGGFLEGVLKVKGADELGGKIVNEIWTFGMSKERKRKALE